MKLRYDSDMNRDEPFLFGEFNKLLNNENNINMGELSNEESRFKCIYFNGKSSSFRQLSVKFLQKFRKQRMVKARKRFQRIFFIC